MHNDARSIPDIASSGFTGLRFNSLLHFYAKFIELFGLIGGIVGQARKFLRVGGEARGGKGSRRRVAGGD